MREKGLIVSFHDVAPHSYEDFAAMAGRLESLGVDRFTWLVVPLWHGRYRLEAESDCAKFLRRRESKGDALVAHGLTHRLEWREIDPSFKQVLVSRVYTNGESEFFGLDEPTLRERVLWARVLMDEAKLPVSGFVAPAWIFPSWGFRVLRETGFSVTETYRHLHLLKTGVRYAAPVVTASSRTGFRSFLSRLVVPALAGVYSGADMIRVAIHPADMEKPSVRNLMCALVAKLRGRRQLYTLASWAEAAWRGGP